MSTFLEKNKKKSALAVLLLFIRTRKTVTALLLLVALSSFLFVSPSNILLNFPGGTRVAAGVAWIAGKVGVDTSKWGLAGSKRDYGDLLAAFRAAKQGGGKAGWSAFMRGGNGAAGRNGPGTTGSLYFVKGNAKDLEGSVGSGESLPQPGDVAGVLNPDDAKKGADGEGVALSQGDMSGERAGMVKSAFASGFGKGSAFGNGFGDGNLSGGAFANSGFFGNGTGGNIGGGSAASGKLSDVVKNGLDGIKEETATGVQIAGGAKGRLSKSNASRISSRTNKGLVGSRTISGQRAFVQLAAGRGRAAISVAPNCSAGSGCPAEFAAVNTGAVYDGNTISGPGTDIIVTGMSFDGPPDMNLPNTNMADDYIAEAEQMNADAEKCRELDDKYGPQELALDQEQEALSDKFDAMGCGQGGCSKSKAKKCQAIGDEMKGLCRRTMDIRCRHIHECPLTANNNCSAAECDGPARNKKKITDVNDGIRTTTMDQGEESAGCVESKNNIASARQSAENALNEYRGNGCEALYSSPLLTDKVKYLSSCSGRESQVVNTCMNYAHALCSSAQTCDGAQCTGDTDACVITDLNGIEEFIHSDAKY